MGETDTLIAVSKPPSIPCHPCGAYRFNSLMFILAKEPVIPNQPPLHLVHRLDRVTSGLVVIAKSKEAAQQVSQEIRDKSTRKTYLARVQGTFPARLHEVDDGKTYTHTLNNNYLHTLSLNASSTLTLNAPNLNPDLITHPNPF